MDGKRGKRRIQCGEKVRYDDPKAASSVARSLQRLQPGKRVDAYKCPFCGKYHIGHSPLKRKKRRKKKATPSANTQPQA